MSKRLVLLFVSILLLVTLIVLFFAVFIVRNVDINANDMSFEIDESEVLLDSRIAVGGSIFNVSEERVAGFVEKSNPNLGVSEIKKTLPNKITISLFERKPLLSFAINNHEKMLLLDKDLKVLDVTDERTDALDQLIRIEGDAINLTNDLDNVAGLFLDRAANYKYERLFLILDGYLVMLDGTKYLENVSSIDLSNSNHAVIGLRDNIKLQIYGQENISLQINEATSYYLNFVAPNPLAVDKAGTVQNDGNGWYYS